MDSGHKVKFFSVLFFGLVLTGLFLFFHFIKIEKQTIVTQKSDNIAVENSPILLVADTPPTKIGEQEKKIPTSLPILMYHYIRNYSDPADLIGVNLSVSPQKFEEQLSWLWEEINEMQKAGMAFGSHTLSHPDLRKLAVVNLEKEIKESKEILEQKLDQKVTDFCYPSGKYTDAVIFELRKDNYQTVDNY